MVVYVWRKLLEPVTICYTSSESDVQLIGWLWEDPDTNGESI